MFPLVQQEMELWCWAAVSVSVDNYFNPRSGRAQCDIAKMVLPDRDCCGDKPSCNSAESLAAALNKIDRLEERLEYPIRFEDVLAQIDAGFPVCLRIAWFGGGAHFVTISEGRTSAGRQMLVIEDPLYGQSTVRYDRFASDYVGGGDWTHTYLTK